MKKMAIRFLCVCFEYVASIRRFDKYIYYFYDVKSSPETSVQICRVNYYYTNYRYCLLFGIRSLFPYLLHSSERKESIEPAKYRFQGAKLTSCFWQSHWIQ